jgi:hypothetical protein
MTILINISNFEYRELSSSIGFVSVIQFTYYRYTVSEYFNCNVRYFGMPDLCNHIEFRSNFNINSEIKEFKHYNTK